MSRKADQTNYKQYERHERHEHLEPYDPYEAYESSLDNCMVNVFLHNSTGEFTSALDRQVSVLIFDCLESILRERK